eukprot:3768212-Rhodomonas_salina.1
MQPKIGRKLDFHESRLSRDCVPRSPRARELQEQRCILTAQAVTLVDPHEVFVELGFECSQRQGDLVGVLGSDDPPAIGVRLVVDRPRAIRERALGIRQKTARAQPATLALLLAKRDDQRCLGAVVGREALRRRAGADRARHALRLRRGASVVGRRRAW